MVKWTAVLRMSRSVDLTNGTNVPLTVNADMSKVVTFETRLMISWMVVGERGVNRDSV